MVDLLQVIQRFASRNPRGNHSSNDWEKGKKERTWLTLRSHDWFIGETLKIRRRNKKQSGLSRHPWMKFGVCGGLKEEGFFYKAWGSPKLPLPRWSWKSFFPLESDKRKNGNLPFHQFPLSFFFVLQVGFKAHGLVVRTSIGSSTAYQTWRYHPRAQ